ncbi:MAG: SPOR domain-containing protein [Methylosarcina sp.]
MDQELKQRLIGAAVVTALAAIFIPMLFDDPIDDSGKIVSEMTIPQPPANPVEDAANKLPGSAEEVTSKPAEAEALTEDLQEPVPQASENGEQEDVVTEDTGQPIDEQQWVEESAVEAEPEQIIEDTPNDISAADLSKPAETDETIQPPAAPEQKRISSAPSSISESLEKQPKTTPAKVATAPSAPSVKKAIVAPKAETPKANKGLSRWYIQAGSFGKKENALARLEDLRKQGLPVLMETQDTEKGTLYRLKVGPQLDKKRAIEIRNRLNKQKIKSIIVAE